MNKIILTVATLALTTNLFAIDLANFVNKEKCDQIIDKQVFTVCYDYEMKGAKYVAYILERDKVNVGNVKKRPRFYTESTIPAKYRSHNQDYTHSGYDRGHLANDASFDYEEKVVVKTYTMANIIPQAPEVNRKTWTKAEQRERDMAGKYKTVNILNGVVYDTNPQRIGKNRIAVPSGFWKAIYTNDNNFEECYLYENDLDAKVKGDKLQNHKIDCSKLN